MSDQRKGESSSFLQKNVTPSKKTEESGDWSFVKGRALGPAERVDGALGHQRDLNVSCIFLAGHGDSRDSCGAQVFSPQGCKTIAQGMGAKLLRPWVRVSASFLVPRIALL